MAETLKQSPEEESVIKLVGKSKPEPNYPQYRQYSFLMYCPKCKEVHFIEDAWMSGTTAAPTSASSLIVRKPGMTRYDGSGSLKCHFFLNKGLQSYCGDCHNGSGARIPLKKVSEWPLKKPKAKAKKTCKKKCPAE